MSKIQCNGCENEFYESQVTKTYLGKLCKGCYNNFLHYDYKYKKKEMIISIFINVIPIILVLMYVYSELVLKQPNPDFLFVYFVIMCFTAYRFVKSEFISVGAPVRKSFYKGQINSDDSITVNEESYSGYTGEQATSMISNVIMFVFGLAIVSIFGPLIFVYRLLSLKKAKRAFDQEYNPDIDPIYVQYDETILNGYKGIMFEKTVESRRVDTYSSIEGIKYKHMSYTIYKNELYGFLMREGDEDNKEIVVVQFKKGSSDYNLSYYGDPIYKEIMSFIKRKRDYEEGL